MKISATKRATNFLVYSIVEVGVVIDTACEHGERRYPLPAQPIDKSCEIFARLDTARSIGFLSGSGAYYF